MWKKWIVLFIFSAPCWAYKLTIDFENGFYWASLPINFTVFDEDPVRKAKLESITSSAIQEWEESSGLALWDFSKSGSSPASSNVLRWSRNFAEETHMDPNSVPAVAIRYTHGPYFARTEIVINGSHFLNHSDTHLKTTITHELGHTMGLDHSEVAEAVMAPSLQTIYWGLHRDDIEGISEAYNQTQHRQLTGYISPLSFESSNAGQQALSCGTVGVVSGPGSTGVAGLLSLVAGLLISFIRKGIKWFKSLL